MSAMQRRVATSKPLTADETKDREQVRSESTSLHAIIAAELAAREAAPAPLPVIRQNRDRHASEADNRLDWAYRETGMPPTYDDLRHIRDYNDAVADATRKESA